MPDAPYAPRQYPQARIGTLREDGKLGANDQWLRKWELTLYGSGRIGSRGALTSGTVITTQTEGHDFRMVFKIRHQTSLQTLPTAEIRIYNLARDTARDVIKEYDRVVLSAGYTTGHYGQIFAGTLKYYKIGRESAVDGYLDIYAAAADHLNDVSINETREPGEAIRAQRQVLLREAKARQEALQDGQIEDPAMKATPFFFRDDVMIGNFKKLAREYERSTNAVWWVENDKINVLPRTAYAKGDIVIINSQTGMIGVPEQTTNGITVTCLLNPNLHVLGRVQLDERSIARYYVPGEQALAGQPGAQWRDQVGMGEYMAPLTADGVYSIQCIDMVGDTRGLPWYSHLICTHQHPDRPYDRSVTAGDWRPT